nr:unnamed protein product [Naegleria fowleri]
MGRQQIPPTTIPFSVQQEIGWIDTPLDHDDNEQQRQQRPTHLLSSTAVNNPYAIPFTSNHLIPSRNRNSPKSSATVASGTIGNHQEVRDDFQVYPTSSLRNIKSTSLLASVRQQQLGENIFQQYEEDDKLQVTQQAPINKLSVNLLVQIFSFLCDQLEEKEEDTSSTRDLYGDNDDDDEIELEDTQTSIETAKNTMLNTSHSLEELSIDGNRSSSEKIRISSPKKTLNKRESAKYYSEFGIEDEDEELTTEWISSGLLSSKKSGGDENVTPLQGSVNTIRRSISVPSISLLMSKNFTENNLEGRSKDDSSLTQKSSSTGVTSHSDKKPEKLVTWKNLKKQNAKEQAKLKNRCEKFMISHAKKRHTWIHYGNANISLVCKRWYIASCHNNVWSLACVMLYLHLTRFSITFRSYDTDVLQRMLSTYYSKPKRIEETRKKLQVLCDYLLPSKSVFMDTVIHVNSKQFSTEHLNAFSAKLTQELSKRASVVRDTVQALDKRITDTANTWTEKLEHHISQNKISNTLLGHDIQSASSPTQHQGGVTLEEVSLETALPTTDKKAMDNENILVMNHHEEQQAKTSEKTLESMNGNLLDHDQKINCHDESHATEEKVPTQSPQQRSNTPKGDDDFEVIPSPTDIGDEIIENHRKRRTLSKRFSTRHSKINFKNIIDDDGMNDTILDQTADLLSSQQNTKLSKRKSSASNQQQALQDEDLSNLNLYSNRYRFFKDTFIEMKKIQQFEFERLMKLNYHSKNPPEMKQRISFLLKNAFPEMLGAMVIILFLFSYLGIIIAMLVAPSLYWPTFLFWMWSIVYCLVWTIVWVTSFILYGKIQIRLNPQRETTPSEDQMTESLIIDEGRQGIGELKELFLWIKSWVTSRSPPRELAEEHTIVGHKFDASDEGWFYLRRLQMKLADHAAYYHLIGSIFVVPVLIILLLYFLMIYFEVSGWLGIFSIPCFIYFVASIISLLLFLIAVWDSIVFLTKKYIFYDLTETVKRQLRVISLRNWPFMLAYGAAMSFLLFWFLIGFASFLDAHDKLFVDENNDSDNNIQSVIPNLAVMQSQPPPPPSSRFTNFSGIGYTFIPLYLAEILTVIIYFCGLIFKSSYYKYWFLRGALLSVSCCIAQILISVLANTELGILCILTIVIPVFVSFIMIVVPQLRYMKLVNSRFAYSLN